MENRHLIIFDGVCNFCNASVKFIIKRDADGIFAFAPMQSHTAKEIMLNYPQAQSGMDTLLLIKHGVCHVRSDAVLEITRDLNGFWSLFSLFKILPKPVRDTLYNLFARNRYRLFGQRDECLIPSREIRKRFID